MSFESSFPLVAALIAELKSKSQNKGYERLQHFKTLTSELSAADYAVVEQNNRWSLLYPDQTKAILATRPPIAPDLYEEIYLFMVEILPIHLGVKSVWDNRESAENYIPSEAKSLTFNDSTVNDKELGGLVDPQIPPMPYDDPTFIGINTYSSYKTWRHDYLLRITTGVIWAKMTAQVVLSLNNWDEKLKLAVLPFAEPLFALEYSEGGILLGVSKNEKGTPILQGCIDSFVSCSLALTEISNRMQGVRNAHGRDYSSFIDPRVLKSEPRPRFVASIADQVSDALSNSSSNESSEPLPGLESSFSDSQAHYLPTPCLSETDSEDLDPLTALRGSSGLSKELAFYYKPSVSNYNMVESSIRNHNPVFDNVVSSADNNLADWSTGANLVKLSIRGSLIILDISFYRGDRSNPHPPPSQYIRWGKGRMERIDISLPQIKGPENKEIQEQA